MQIKTKETVQNTLNKYRWDSAIGWSKKPLGGFSRDLYQRGDLSIRQEINQNEQAVVFEMPQLTMRVSSGKHPDLMTIAQSKDVPFYSLSVFSTVSDKTVYKSFEDDAGYKDISGDRQMILNFLEKVPDAYFVLEKDEHACHVSTCWMRPRNLIKKTKPAHRFVDNLRGQRD